MTMIEDRGAPVFVIYVYINTKLLQINGFYGGVANRDLINNFLSLFKAYTKVIRTDRHMQAERQRTYWKDLQPLI